MKGLVAHERPAYRTIDFVRAAAAIAVVWNHCFNMLLQPVGPGSGAVYHLLAISASFGRDAVIVFFVISGYWITRSVSASVSRGSWSWRDYLVNRLSRLWIVLIPALALGLLLDGVGRFVLDVPPYRALGWQGTGFVDVGRHLSASIAVGNALFLQDLLVPPLGSNSALWTLSKEFWYYIWFPTLVLAFRGRPNVFAVAATAATIWLSGWNALLFACWLAGSVVAWWDRRTATHARPGPGVSRRWWVVLAIGVWLACAALARWRGLNYYEGCFLIAGGFAVCLGCILRCDIDMPPIAWPVARYGANASFSLYAYHLPVLVAVIAMVNGSGALALSPGGVAVGVVVWLGLIGGGAIFAGVTERRTDWLRARIGALIAPRAGASVRPHPGSAGAGAADNVS